MPLHLEDELLQAVADNRKTVTDVEQLLARGADPNAGLFGDDTALSIAVHNGNDDILDLLLRGGPPIVCMREQHENDQRAPPTRVRVWKTMRFIGISFAEMLAKMSVATYVVCRLAVIVFPPGSLRTACLYGSYYLWFIQQCSTASAVSNRTLRQRWLTPSTYFAALLDMALSHQIVGFLIRRILPEPPRAVPAPSVVRDLAVAVPLRLFVDATTTVGRTLLTKAGFHHLRVWRSLSLRTSGQERWTGELPYLADWRSPAEKTVQSIFESDSVTETVVLKLLQEELLASRPYKTSEVAHKLFHVAINKCWANLVEYLLKEGVLVDHRPFSSAMRWPAQADAIQHVFHKANLDTLPAQNFQGRQITNQYIWFRRDPGSISTFVMLAQSTKFRELASSEVNDGQIKADNGRADCHRMMNVLRDGGANPLLVDRSGCDALSHLVKFPCSRSVFQKMADLWKEARLQHSASTGENGQATSRALYDAVNTTKPNLEVLRILLEAGVSPNWQFGGLTPLYTAAYMNESTDGLDLLCQFGADVNNGGRDGFLPILRTLSDASYEKFLFFLDHGVDPNETGRDGKTILQEVLELALPVVVLKGRLAQCLIERGAVVYDARTRSSPAFLTAVRQRNSSGWSEKIMDLLLEQIPEEEQQAQLDAAVQAAACERKGTFRNNCSQFTVFYLLRKGANPAVVRAGRNTLLHLLCEADRPRDHEFREDMAALLARGTLDVNAKGEGGASPLYHAVQRRSRDFVLLLLAHGADPNFQDATGLTPFQHLARKQPEECTIAQTTLDVAGDAVYSGVRGQAASGFVARGRKNGVKQSLEEEEIFQALADHGADMWATDQRGRTPLLTACEVGNAVLVANIVYRVSGGGQPEGQHLRHALGTADGAGKTVLHLAAANGSLATLKVLFRPRRVFCREMNKWRALAAAQDRDTRGTAVERDTESKNSGQDHDHDRELAEKREERMAEQESDYERSSGRVPSFMIPQHVYFSAADGDDVRLTVGDAARRRDDPDRLCLPNVSVSEWPDERWDEEVYSHSDSSCGPAEKLVDVDGRTPLHLAAAEGRLEAVKYMLAFSGLPADVRDKEGRTAADSALKNNFFDIYSVLLERAES